MIETTIKKAKGILNKQQYVLEIKTKLQTQKQGKKMKQNKNEKFWKTYKFQN